MPSTNAEFPCCIYWHWEPLNEKVSGSHFPSDLLQPLPSSRTNCTVFTPKTPEVSMASGMKACSTVSANLLLETAPDPITWARLLASRVRESGAWLNVLPLSSLSLGMDDSTIRVAVGLRLGAPLCRPHKCHHCGAEVDCL